MDVSLTVMEGLWERYTAAELSADHLWVVSGSPGEASHPRGVLPWVEEGDAIDTASVTDRRTSPRPRRAQGTVGDVLTSLRELTWAPEHERPLLLLRHVQKYGSSPLCVHGLPLWHNTPSRQHPAGVTRSGASCMTPPPAGGRDAAFRLNVEAVVRIADFFDSLLELAYRIRHGQAVQPNSVAPIMELPFAAEPICHVVQAELARDGKLSPGRARQLVMVGADRFLHESRVDVGVSWRSHNRPVLASRVWDSWGALCLEVIRGMGVDDKPVEPYVCDVCGRRFTLPRRPKPGDSLYCQSPDCQKVRKSRNRARERAQYEKVSK